MKRPWILATLLFAACAGGYPEATPEDLIHRESEFARSVSDGDVDRFSSFLAEDATFIATDGSRLEGRDEILAEWRPMIERPETTLTWKPLRAMLADDGSMGFTYGDWKMTRRVGDGSELLGTGRFSSVWRRAEDGVWRVVFDIGNADETPRVEISF